MIRSGYLKDQRSTLSRNADAKKAKAMAAEARLMMSANDTLGRFMRCNDMSGVEGRPEVIGASSKRRS
jgi:hypothetical protein